MTKTARPESTPVGCRHGGSNMLSMLARIAAAGLLGAAILFDALNQNPTVLSLPTLAAIFQ